VLLNKDGSDTCPIVLISHLYIDMESPFNGIVAMANETRALLKAPMEFVLSDQGQEVRKAFAFASTTKPIRNKTKTQLNKELLGFSEEYALEEGGTVTPRIAAREDSHYISHNMQSCPRIDRACIDALIEQLDSRLPSFITDDNTFNIRKFSVEIAALVLTIMLSIVILKKLQHLHLSIRTSCETSYHSAYRQNNTEKISISTRQKKKIPKDLLLLRLSPGALPLKEHLTLLRFAGKQLFTCSK
jgi:hypothetical protein